MSQTDIPSQEPQVMDKKIFSPPAKAAPPSLDSSRQRQDVPVGNQLPKCQSKSPRRRESPVGAGSSSVQNFRQDASFPSRKPTPQKSKALDKRPRPRVFNIQEQVVNQARDREQDVAPEYGSLQSPGSKKQNLNHLLNFYFAPRENRAADSKPYAQQGTSSHGRPKFIKEEFIQANCQFMLEKSANSETVEVYKYQPDLLVDWKSIEQIMIRTYGETPVCPICLSPPCAAKMTRCGHIFCFPCILNYLAYSENEKVLSIPCPICYETVTQNDLKSVVANICQELHTGDTIEMQLMCRPKDSSAVEMPLACKLGNRTNWESRFKKLILVSLEQLEAEVLDREKKELLEREREMNARAGQDLEKGYTVEQAISREPDFLQEAMQLWESRYQSLRKNIRDRNDREVEKTKLLTSSGAPTSNIPKPELDDAYTRFARDMNIIVGPEFTQVVYNTSTDLRPTIEEPYHKEELLKDENMNMNSYHCFYQAADGRNAFLIPLNMAMLYQSFGDAPHSWPQRVEFRILEIEYFTMTPESRKRFRFLQHVPLSTCVQLVEVELKPPMISEEVAGNFSPQVNERKRRRSERVRQEKRRERLKLEAERRQLPQHPKIESMMDFPTCGADEDKMLELALKASLAVKPHVDHVHYDGSDTEHYQAEPGRGDDRGVEIPQPCNTSRFGIGNDGFPGFPLSTSPSMSFAQACTSSPPNRPIWKKSPTYPLTTGAQSGQSLRRVASEPEPDGSGSSSVRPTISDAIAHAFANLAENTGCDVAEGESNGNGQKKKKKKKGKVLFATGMGMGNN